SVKGQKDAEVPLGLAQHALKLLREADPKRMSAQEKPIVAAWQIRLMLTMGMGKDLRETFGPELRKTIQPLLGPGYDEFEILYSASTGQYAQVDAALANWEKSAPMEKVRARLDALEKSLKEEVPGQFASLLPAFPLVAGLEARPTPRFTIAGLVTLKHRAEW